MTAPQVIAWRVVENALHAWIAGATGLTTIWEDQRAPQPTYPYVSLNVSLGSSAMPVKAEEIWRDDGEIKLRRQRDFTLTAQVHIGPPDANRPECHGRATLDAALMFLDSPGINADFAAAGIGMRAIGEVNDLDLEIGGEWISRSVVDIRFGVAAILENVPATVPGYFNKVEVSSDYQGLQDPSSGLNLDDEILDPANP